MSASWGVAPAIGRVHAYLMVRNEALTEREIREALGLSHRAASLALADAEAWGIVERVSEPRRVGGVDRPARRTSRSATLARACLRAAPRGPAGTGRHGLCRGRRSLAVVHLGSSPSARSREGDPIVEVIDRTAVEATTLAGEHPRDRELAALRDWLVAFNAFVRLFDRAVGLIPKLQPRELERGMRLLGQVPDETILRLVHLLGGLAGRRRARPRRRAQPPLADRRAPGHEADVGGRPDRRPLGSFRGHREQLLRRRARTARGFAPPG